MELEGRKSLVLGAGRSGVAAAFFLANRGATVALHDRKPTAAWSEDAVRLKSEVGVGLIEGDLPSWLLDQIDLVVISPGIPTNSIPARYVDRNDGEVIGEVELASRFLKGRIVAITGSNGKTTTTALVGELLKDAGMKVQVGGNIGTPLVSLVDTSSETGLTVAELSSFQLETIKSFRPDVAACLNVTPNHLDRYDSFRDYALAKHRIFMNQTYGDTAILNADDAITASWETGLKAKVIKFSVKSELDDGLFLRGTQLIHRSNGADSVLGDRSDILLKGLHNVENVLAALATGLSCEVAVETMRETLGRFRGVEHRIEFAGEIRGISFYNDSKATSVDATLKALEALSDGPGKTVLICGGRGKNAPYGPLADLIRSSVRGLVVIGEDADNIAVQLAGTAPIGRAYSMEEAVSLAYSRAERGDSILLAPACASFDMFRSFEHRGEAFKAAVRVLEKSTRSANR